MIQFNLTNIDTGLVEFILHHNPAWEIPFITISGEAGHVFNWNIVDGSLIMDGTPMVQYTIVIERIIAP